jgi:hypothetical protein
VAVGRNGIQSSALLVVELETWNTGSEVEPRSVLAGTGLTKFPRKLRARTVQVGSSHFVGHRIPLYGSIIPGYASTYSFKRGTASESVSHIGKACVASDAALNPRITGNKLRLWETEVLDEIYTPGVFTEVCVPEAVSTDVLIGIRAGCFDPCPSFFQRLETTRLPSRSLRQLRQGVKQLFRPNGKPPASFTMFSRATLRSPRSTPPT